MADIRLRTGKEIRFRFWLSEDKADTASRSRSRPKMEDNLFTSPKQLCSVPRQFIHQQASHNQRKIWYHSRIESQKNIPKTIYSESRFGELPTIRSLKKACVFAYTLFLLSGNTSVGSQDMFLNGEKKATVIVTNGDLSVLFRDNSASPEILSGIQSLFNKKDAWSGNDSLVRRIV
jgi:hypothetical protein